MEAKLVIAFYISRFQNPIDPHEMIKFGEDMSSIYHVQYDEIGFCIRNGKKETTKVLKFTTKNKDKLLQVDPNDILQLVLNSKKPNNDLFTDPKFRIKFFIQNDKSYPNIIYAIIDSELIHELTVDDIEMWFDKVSLLGFSVEYGASFSIETSKEPNYFLIGVITPKLNREERHIARALALNIRQYREKIWDVFLINIISKQVLSPVILAEILEIVPESCVRLNGEFYIVSLPMSFHEYLADENKRDYYKNKLREVFLRHDLIMYQEQDSVSDSC